MHPFFQNVAYPWRLEARAYQLASLDYTPHWHLDVEIVQVLEGELQLGLGESEFLLGPGETVIVSSRQVHSYATSHPHTQLIIAMFNPLLVGCPEGWPAGGHLRITPLGVPDAEDPARLEFSQVLRRMVDETSRYDAQSPDFLRACLFQLTGLGLRHFSQAPETGAATTHSGAARDTKLAYELLNFVDLHYTEPLTSEALAQQFDLSSAHLSRVFKRVTGTTVGQYLIDMRLQRVKELLLSSEGSIIDIAFACGFDNLRTFNRQFHKAFGTSPREFRAGR